jgi:hypothetical protein
MKDAYLGFADGNILNVVRAIIDRIFPIVMQSTDEN